MKVLIYAGSIKAISVSGIGRAFRQQQKALALNDFPFTTDPRDTYDLVHINTLFPDSYRLLKKAQKKGLPVIVHGHSTFEDFRDSFRVWKLIRPWFYGQIKKMYKRADLIITPTPYSKHLIEGYGYNKKVVAISNGVDLSEYAPNPQYVEDFKEYFGIKKGEKVIIGVGLFFPRKGIYDFLEVARSFPEVKFIWFGHLAPILTQMKMNKAIRNRPANVIFPGYISNEVIKGAFQYASLVFFPSYEETEGIVALEALASRTPLLVRDIGVYEGWLVDGQNSYMGKTNEDFCAKIKYIMENDNTKIVENGYRTIMERSLEKCGAQTIAVYKELMKDRKDGTIQPEIPKEKSHG